MLKRDPSFGSQTAILDALNRLPVPSYPVEIAAPLKELKEAEPSESTQINSTTAPVVTVPIKQLLKYSCTAFSCATLFSQLIQKTNQEIENPEKILRLFEIAIYPHVWKERKWIADEQKSIQYLRQYLNEDPIIIIIISEEKIELALPLKGEAFFIIEEEKGESHVKLAVEEENQFVYQGKRYSSLFDISDKIKKIIKVKEEDFNMSSIQALYQQAQENIKQAVFSYSSECYQHFDYISSLLRCCHLFPEYKNAIIEIALSHFYYYFPDLVTLKEIVEILPEYRDRISAIFLNNFNYYFEYHIQTISIQEIIAIFPEHGDKLVELNLKLSNPKEFSPHTPLTESNIFGEGVPFHHSLDNYSDVKETFYFRAIEYKEEANIKNEQKNLFCHILSNMQIQIFSYLDPKAFLFIGLACKEIASLVNNNARGNRLYRATQNHLFKPSLLTLTPLKPSRRVSALTRLQQRLSGQSLAALHQIQDVYNDQPPGRGFAMLSHRAAMEEIHIKPVQCAL